MIRRYFVCVIHWVNQTGMRFSIRYTSRIFADVWKPPKEFPPGIECCQERTDGNMMCYDMDNTVRYHRMCAITGCWKIPNILFATSTGVRTVEGTAAEAISKSSVPDGASEAVKPCIFEAHTAILVLSMSQRYCLIQQ